MAPAWGRRGPPSLARTAGGRFCCLHPSRWHHSANSRHTREPREGDARTSPSDIISFLKGSPQSYSFNSPVFLSDGVVTFYIVRSRLLICTCFKDFFSPFSGLCVGQPSSLARFTILYLNATFSLFFFKPASFAFWRSDCDVLFVRFLGIGATSRWLCFGEVRAGVRLCKIQKN